MFTDVFGVSNYSMLLQIDEFETMWDIKTHTFWFLISAVFFLFPGCLFSFLIFFSVSVGTSKQMVSLFFLSMCACV